MCVRLCLCDDPVPGVTLARALLACKSRIVPRRGRDQHPPLVFASPSLIFPAPQSSYPLELWVFARCDFWRCDCTRHHQLMAIQIACPVVFDRAGFVSCAERWKKCVRLCACVRARCWRRPDMGAAGDFHALLLRSDGTVAACGSNDDGQCDVPAGCLQARNDGAG